MSDNRSIMQRLIDAGYPVSEMDHHESDLYVYATKLAFDTILTWLDDNGYRFDVMVDVFTDQITGRKMYDIAFGYDPYWNDKCGRMIDNG